MNDLNEKYQQLIKIRKTAQLLQSRTPSPCYAAAVVAGIVAAAVSCWGLSLSAVVSVFTGFAVSFLAYQYLPLSKSWYDSLDDRITAYEPVNQEAYAELHKATRDMDGFNLIYVFHWLDREERAIRSRLPLPARG